METTHEEFQTHYRYISHVIDFLTTFQDSRRIIEKTLQSDIDNLLRSLHMLRNASDYFDSFINTVRDHPEHPEGPENPEGWPIEQEQPEENIDETQ